MKENKFTDEYGYTYNYDEAEYDDRSVGSDVSYLLKIFDKDKKLVYKEHVFFGSIPPREQLEKFMLEKAEEIIDDIRPRTQEEWKASFDEIRKGLNPPPTNESFKVFFRKRS